MTTVSSGTPAPGRLQRAPGAPPTEATEATESAGVPDDLEPIVTPLDIPGRQRQLPTGGRLLHQRILRAFVETGRAPQRDELGAMAADLGLDPELAMRGLAEIDLVHVDADGVVVAYPFSGRDTGVLVRFGDGPQVPAMCAIDALGIPPMTGRDAVITATDPHSGEPVRVESVGGQWSWQPEDAVVLVGRNETGTTSADKTCPTITFHTTEDSASSHLAGNNGITGRVLSRDQALDVAAKLFGGLLAE